MRDDPRAVAASTLLDGALSAMAVARCTANEESRRAQMAEASRMLREARAHLLAAINDSAPEIMRGGEK